MRSFSQGGSGKAKLCEAAGVALEQYEAAQQRVEERQSEYNKHEAVKRRCKKKAKPLNRALVGLRKRLKNCREKIKGLETPANGESPYQLVQSDSELESEIDSGDESADSGAGYAPGDKRKSSRVNASSSKRRRQSFLSDADSGSDLELDISSDDNSDESEEEEEVVVPVPKKGSGPSTLPELQAYAEELETAIADKSAIVKTLKCDYRSVTCHIHGVCTYISTVYQARDGLITSILCPPVRSCHRCAISKLYIKPELHMSVDSDSYSVSLKQACGDHPQLPHLHVLYLLLKLVCFGMC